MEKIRDFAKWFASITTGTVIVCAVNFSVLSNGDLPRATLWHILLVGLLTTSVTVFFTALPLKKPHTLIGRHMTHYICLCIVMIACGCSFEWMQFNLSGITMMVLSVTGVYIFSFTVNYYMDKRLADEINKRLKEMSGGKDD